MFCEIMQFDKYMNEYKRSHPELTDHDLPRFEDMDHNNNGHINFNEVLKHARTSYDGSKNAIQLDGMRCC